MSLLTNSTSAEEAIAAYNADRAMKMETRKGESIHDLFELTNRLESVLKSLGPSELFVVIAVNGCQLFVDIIDEDDEPDTIFEGETLAELLANEDEIKERILDDYSYLSEEEDDDGPFDGSSLDSGYPPPAIKVSMEQILHMIANLPPPTKEQMEEQRRDHRANMQRFADDLLRMQDEGGR